jgi:acyl-CoA thioester hydrolase
MTFTYEHRVSYAECTIGNHVYHSRYLDILERARGEFCRAISYPLTELQRQDLIFPVIECRLTFNRPARYDDVLKVNLRLKDVSRLRLTFMHEITRPADAATILRAETMHICSSIEEKPKRMPKELVKALEPYLMDAAKLGEDDER